MLGRQYGEAARLFDSARSDTRLTPEEHTIATCIASVSDRKQTKWEAAIAHPDATACMLRFVFFVDYEAERSGTARMVSVEDEMTLRRIFKTFEHLVSECCWLSAKDLDRVWADVDGESEKADVATIAEVDTEAAYIDVQAEFRKHVPEILKQAKAKYSCGVPPAVEWIQQDTPQWSRLPHTVGQPGPTLTVHAKLHTRTLKSKHIEDDAETADTPHRPPDDEPFETFSGDLRDVDLAFATLTGKEVDTLDVARVRELVSRLAVHSPGLASQFEEHKGRLTSWMQPRNTSERPPQPRINPKYTPVLGIKRKHVH